MDRQDNINDLKVTYSTLKKIMKDEEMTQDNSFKRVLYYIALKLADNACM